MNSPDSNSTGFLACPPDPLRYGDHSRSPDDVGMKIASLILPNSRVLDVGCGIGSLAQLIQQQTKAEIIGIEPDTARVKIAIQRGVRVFEGLLSVEFLSEHGPFDTIVFADVLEHLSSPGEMILLAKTGLTPSGSIVASVPNIAHWFVRIDLLRGEFAYRDCGIMDATHLRWFTHESLNLFFGNLGFHITDYLYTINTGMDEYRRYLPWRLLPEGTRLRMVRQLVTWFPTVFGCQLVVKAVAA